MANTFTQLYVQVVFAVKGRENLILEKNREKLQKYITSIVENRKQKMISIYAMPDHVHLLIGLNPNDSISSIVRDVKAVSSKFINEQKWVKVKFNWQEEYGAFTYSKSQLNRVVNYINNQKEHHRKKSFKEEYFEFLKKFQIDYNEKYLFDWIE